MQDSEIKALVSLLSDDDAEVLTHVEDKIRSLGDRVIPFLETEWEQSFEPNVQQRIEDLIHELQFEVLKQKLKTWSDEGSENLLEGMWLISTYQYPDLEFEKLEDNLNQIFYEVWVAMRDDLYAFDQIKTINSIFFGKLRFLANTKNFHAPANSMINQVLETRRGNPISLCVLYMLIAQKLKVPVYGVNLPNLFILTYKSDDMQFYINAFNKGIIFTEADIDNYLDNLKLPHLDLFYQPCSHIAIVKRTLRNLTVSFERTGDYDKAEEVKQLLAMLPSDSDDTEQHYDDSGK